MKTRWIVGKPAGKLLRARVQRRLPHSIRDVYIRLKNVVTLTRTYVARNRVHIATTLYILEMDRRTFDVRPIDRARSLRSFDKSILPAISLHALFRLGFNDYDRWRVSLLPSFADRLFRR